MTDGFGDGQFVLAATPELEQHARQFGVNVGDLRILDVAVDDEVFRPVTSHEAPGSGDPFGVACVADLPDVRPAALSVELETHVRLWQRVCQIAADRPETPAATILDVAQRDSGVMMKEEHLRTWFTALIRDRLLPMLHTRLVVESLLASGVDVRVFGAGWELSEVPPNCVSGAPASPEQRNLVYNRAAVVVCPVFDERVPQMCLEASMAGACVALREPENRIDAQRPGLADVLTQLPQARELRSFIRLTGRLVSNADRRQVACRQARDTIAGRHLWTHRLKAVLEALAEHPVAP
jgi:hypothetical protein